MGRERDYADEYEKKKKNQSDFQFTGGSEGLIENPPPGKRRTREWIRADDSYYQMGTATKQAEILAARASNLNQSNQQIQNKNEPGDQNKSDNAPPKSNGFWHRLFGGDEQKQSEQPKQKQKQKTKQQSTSDIANLGSVDKLGEAVSRGAKALPGELAEELKAVLSPATLASLVAVLGIYLAAHATGIGQAMDIGMLIAGGIFFGLDAFTIFKDLAGFAGAINATTEEELDTAGAALASAIAKIGVDAVMTLLTKKVTDEVGKSVDHVNQVDEVTASSDNVNSGRGDLDGSNNVNANRGNDVNNLSTNQGREVQRIPDADIVESNNQQNTNFKGSGPAPGFIEISSGVKSTKAIENLNPKEPMDFVFDPINKRFVVGSRKRLFGHDGIMDAAGRGIRNDHSVGGRIGRRDGVLYTDEWSGHYGDRWNDALRQQFESFKQEFRLNIPHLDDHDTDHLTK